MTNINLKKLTAAIKNTVTPNRLKKTGVMLLITGVGVSSGLYYHHMQKAEASASKIHARSQMVRNQAESASIALLDESTVRSIVADTIGVDESSIYYHKIAFKSNYAHDYDDDDRYKKHEKRDKDGKHDKDKKSERNHREKEEHRRRRVDSASGSHSDAFQPVYKVKCYVDLVEYELVVDAVTGALLDYEIDT